MLPFKQLFSCHFNSGLLQSGLHLQTDSAVKMKYGHNAASSFLFLFCGRKHNTQTHSNHELQPEVIQDSPPFSVTLPTYYLTPLITGQKVSVSPLLWLVLNLGS